MKETQTAIVDLGVFNQALNALGLLSGEVSFLKVQPIIQQFAQSIIPPPEDAKCPLPTPQKSSSRKSATGQ